MAKMRSTQPCFERYFEIARTLNGSHFYPMEGLRGFAVLLVFLVHYVSLYKLRLEYGSLFLGFAEKIQSVGHTGVDLFFVLSGYLIYGSLIKRPQNFFHYLKRRLVRIYPCFLVVFIIYLVLSYVFPTENKIPSDPGRLFLYIFQNLIFLPGIFPIKPIITVAWSLSYEFFYYLAVPALIALLSLREKTTLWRVSFFSVLAVLILSVFSFYPGPIRLVMFIAGIFVFEVLRSKSIKPLPAFTTILMVCFSFLIKSLNLPGTSGVIIENLILFVAFFYLFYGCFDENDNFLVRIFSWKPLRWLGNMSYSYYLMHGLTLKFLFMILSRVDLGHSANLVFFMLLPIFFAVTLLPASALFIVVERRYSLK